MEPTVPQPKLEPGVYQGTPPVVQKKEGISSPRIIRTMKSDTMEVMKEQNETFVSMALAEERKLERARLGALAAQQTQSENAAPAKKRIGRVVIVLIVLLLISLSALAYIFILPKLGTIKLPSLPFSSSVKPSTPDTTSVAPVALPLAPSIIPAQTEKRFNISTQTATQITSEITAELGKGNPAGSIKNLYFSEYQGGVFAPATADRLFAFGNIPVPDILSRSLEKQFMAGFFGESNGGGTPFLILKVSDRDTALAGMLEWESSLPKFFDTFLGTRIGGDITVRFSDTTISGKDARSLDTTSGTTIVYAFADQNTIVIAGSTTSLEALISLATKK